MGLLDEESLIMGIDVDLNSPFKEEDNSGCGGSKACLICEFWEVERSAIFGYFVFGEPLVNLAHFFWNHLVWEIVALCMLFFVLV